MNIWDQDKNSVIFSECGTFEVKMAGIVYCNTIQDFFLGGRGAITPPRPPTSVLACVCLTTKENFLVLFSLTQFFFLHHVCCITHLGCSLYAAPFFFFFFFFFFTPTAMHHQHQQCSLHSIMLGADIRVFLAQLRESPMHNCLSHHQQNYLLHYGLRHGSLPHYIGETH